MISTLPDSTAILVDSETLRAARGSGSARMLALAVVLLGLAAYASAWLRLCRHVSAASGADHGEALALVRHAAVVWSAPLVLAPPLFSRDGWSYAAQGLLAHYRISPYDSGPGVLRGPIVQGVDPMWMETPSPYGPLPTAWGEFAAGFTGNPWLLVVSHRMVALCGLVLLAWSVPKLSRWCGTNPAVASAFALCSPLVIAHGVGGLHNDIVMVGLMTSALVIARDYGWLAGSVMGGLAAAVKLPGGLVCIGVALLALSSSATVTDRLKRFAQVGAVAVATLVVAGLVSGLGVGWVHALSVPGTVKVPLSLTTVAGQGLDLLASLTSSHAPRDFFLDIIRLLGQVVALVIAVRVALRWRAGDPAAAVSAVATVTGALVVLSPVVHLWYFLWVLPFLAAMRLPRIGVVGLVWVAVVAGVAAPLDSSLHGAYLAIVVGSLVATGLVLALLATTRARATLDRVATAVWLPDPGSASVVQRAGRIRPVTSPSAIRPPEAPGAV